jgi:predicted N-acetyltransferase YhbS
MTLALAPLLDRTAPDPWGAARLEVERPEDDQAVMALVEEAFGPGRYAKTSERLREGNRHLPSLSFCIREGAEVLGAVRQWPLLVGEREGLFLGPIAVEAGHRSRGCGAALIAACVAAAAAEERAFILLVGDMPVFAPHGFVVAPPGRILMPAPVHPSRLLVRPLAEGILADLAGIARPPARATRA